MKFSHIISVSPPSFCVHKKLDNEIYLIDITDKSSWWVGVGIITFLSISIPFLPSEELLNPIGLPTLIILFFIGVYLIIHRLIQKPKEIIFNRLTGKITVPRFMWMKSITFPFNEAWASVVWGNIGDNMGAALNCGHVSNKFKGGDIGFGNSGDFEAEWSQYVWYMDKNRPLPPNKAFDKYRDIDFERRKAAGFPPPLYKSKIPTPEATPEQQKEREKYWKDRDYMVK